ncbi:Hypothetical predicted protein [Olea europaea subsp. europaea]|uniref:Aminotransferase-like plant mobile domain-containing protein n=1 Tax=Olea europaea subsp. europaea TaxID=158383 RepID=A0A8S0RTY8_OLEEU|nr:Hypothetical predicted protein [Olea europaea subsp. europaea]
MPIEADAITWRTLLIACNIHDINDLSGVGEKVRQKLLELEPRRSGNFVMVANKYAEAGLWEKVTNRITPTLDDVARITGFSIDGLPVIGRDYKADECPGICSELLLSPRLLHPKNRCDVILKELLSFKDIPLVLVGAGLDPYVRAYVLYVIGCFLSPRRDHSSVPCMYLSLLRDVDAIQNYAWGAALLCQLHHTTWKNLKGQ